MCEEMRNVKPALETDLIPTAKGGLGIVKGLSKKDRLMQSQAGLLLC